MLRFTSLDVVNYRGLARPVHLRFGKRYNLVIGDNGAGKTNLLRLMSMISSLNFSELFDESFEVRWSARDEELQYSITGRVIAKERALAGPTLAAVASGIALPRLLTWELAVSDSTGEHVYSETDIDATREHLFIVGSMFVKVSSDMGSRFWSYFSARAARMDEALETFKVLTEGRSTGSATEVLPFSVTIISQGGEVKVAMMSACDATTAVKWGQGIKDSNGPTLTHLDLPWLDKVREDLGVAALVLRPLFQEKRQLDPSSAEMVVFSGAELNVSLTPHRAVKSDLLSYGQKRVIALRYYLAAHEGGPAIIDELSNGLHHAWVESLLVDLEGRQSLLATQNPLVMDGLWWETSKDAGESIILCTRNAEHGWVWRQLDEDEADRFYSAWRAGVQQIHEVLRTENWW